MKQQSFALLSKPNPESGGALFIGRRKTKRTLALRTPIHLVLKSNNAKGAFSFVNHQRNLQKIIDKISQKYGVKIYSKAINFDHIHLVVILQKFNSYKSFIREVSKEIVLCISRATKTKLKSFFTLRPYTRLLTWGRQFKTVLEYLDLNRMEVFGLRPPKRKNLEKPKGVGK